MNIAIIEDEQLAAERLAGLVKSIEPAATIVAQLPSIEASVTWLRHNTPDLILLDIQLSDGESFAIFDRVDVHVPVIFTTAYDQYAIRAFKLHSVDYLLKPIRKEDLRASLHKFKEMKAAYSLNIQEMVKSLRDMEPAYKKRFLVQYGQKIRKVETEDIAFFYALDKGVFLVTFQKETLPVDNTLDGLEELLDPEHFFRINRKMIVAFRSIKHMTAFSRSRIKIDLDPPCPAALEALVSVERAAAFRKWMYE